MDVASLHQTECLASIATHMQCLAVELPCEGVERAHNVTNGAIAMICCMWSFGLICPLKHTRVRFFHHLLAEINADQVFLEDVVVEHILCCFTQIYNPLTKCWGLYSIGHILSIDRAGCVVVATYSADSACNEVGIPR